MDYQAADASSDIALALQVGRSGILLAGYVRWWGGRGISVASDGSRHSQGPDAPAADAV